VAQFGLADFRNAMYQQWPSVIPLALTFVEIADLLLQQVKSASSVFYFDGGAVLSAQSSCGVA
jgi:hypothetical protein